MVIIFCILLSAGIITGQVFNFSGVREILTLLTSVCLAFIMINVGLEFSVDNRKIQSYGWDFLVAATAALLPAFFWFLYFVFIIHSSWQPALLSGVSSAPTSAGILFAMLMAAGLSATWVFKKARTLAVLDDLVVILLLTPLQIVFYGFEWQSFVLLGLITGLLFISFYWKNLLSWPVTDQWLLVYACALTAMVLLIKHTTNIHLEVLIPAFVLGCVVRHVPAHHTTEKPQPVGFSLNTLITGSFMFLVGVSFPKVSLGGFSLAATVGHVLILTLLANLGKCFPAFCYHNEAPLNKRLALSVAMFPRGEVGAAVLLIGLGLGMGGYITTLALLSLAFNLVLTGFFIWMVIKLSRN